MTARTGRTQDGTRPARQTVTDPLVTREPSTQDSPLSAKIAHSARDLAPSDSCWCSAVAETEFRSYPKGGSATSSRMVTQLPGTKATSKRTSREAHALPEQVVRSARRSAHAVRSEPVRGQAE